MTDYKIPELPSDEELGIAGMDEAAPAAPPKRTLHLGPRRRPGQPAPTAKVEAPGGGGLWMGPATLLVLLAIAWATSSSRVLPRTVPLTAPDTVFSSGRAMLDIVALSAHPRPPGTPEHDSARAYLSVKRRELSSGSPRRSTRP